MLKVNINRLREKDKIQMKRKDWRELVYEVADEILIEKEDFAVIRKSVEEMENDPNMILEIERDLNREFSVYYISDKRDFNYGKIVVINRGSFKSEENVLER